MKALFSVYLNGELAGRGMRMDMALLMMRAILEEREENTEMTVEIRRETEEESA